MVYLLRIAAFFVAGVSSLGATSTVTESELTTELTQPWSAAVRPWCGEKAVPNPYAPTTEGVLSSSRRMTREVACSPAQTRK